MVQEKVNFLPYNGVATKPPKTCLQLAAYSGYRSPSLSIPGFDLC